METLRVLAVITLILGFSGFVHSQAETREITIPWDPKPNALKYQVQIGNSAELTNLIFDKETKQPELTINIPAGNYFYRLRWYNQAGKPSPWTEVEPFVINLKPPTPLRPTDGAVFSKSLRRGGIAFGWSEGVKGSTYQIEIRDDHGVVMKREVDTTQVPWLPTAPGKYQWRVGYKSDFADEWSEYRNFLVNESAIKSKPIVIVEKPVWSFWKFRANLVQMTQPGTSLLTSEVSWNPSLLLKNRTFGFMAQVGVTQLTSNDKNVFAVDYGAYFLVAMKSILFEIGPGAQTWSGEGTYPLIGLNINWLLPSKSFLIDRIFFGYEYVILPASAPGNAPTNPTQLFKLGIGI